MKNGSVPVNSYSILVGIHVGCLLPSWNYIFQNINVLLKAPHRKRMIPSRPGILLNFPVNRKVTVEPCVNFSIFVVWNREYITFSEGKIHCYICIKLMTFEWNILCAKFAKSTVFNTTKVENLMQGSTVTFVLKEKLTWIPGLDGSIQLMEPYSMQSAFLNNLFLSVISPFPTGSFQEYIYVLENNVLCSSMEIPL